MRIGILGSLLLVACTTAATTTAPAPAPTATSTPGAPCNDSSQCGPDAVCCATASARASMTPFGPAHTMASICSTDPVRECQGHEICGVKPCHVPWPDTRVPPTPARTYTIECRTARDCPKDTTCAYFYFSPNMASSLCVYNVTAEPHAANVAPACATDADCKAALPKWKSVLGDEAYPAALAGARCVELKTDPDRRRVCSIPGNAPLP